MKNGIYERRGPGHQAIVHWLHIDEDIVIAAGVYQVGGEYRDNGGWTATVWRRPASQLDLTGFRLAKEYPPACEVIEDIESRLTRADCDAWHNGDDPTPNIERLIEQYGAFEVWGMKDHQGTEEPLRVVWPY